MQPHQVISLEDLPGRNQLRAARPLRPRPHRLPPDRSGNPFDQQFSIAAQAGPVAAPDQPPRPDRKPRSPDQALASTRCPTKKRERQQQRRRQHGPRRLADRRLLPGESEPWPSSSDSRSSTSPALSALADGRYLARERRPAPRRACSSWRPWRAARPAGAGAAARARPTRPPRRRRCRWRGRPRCAPSSRSRTSARPPAGSTRRPRPRTRSTSWSAKGSACSTGPCTRRRVAAADPPAASCRPSARSRSGSATAAASRSRAARFAAAREVDVWAPALRGGAGAPKSCARRSGSPACSAGASGVDPCETLLLRARADLDAGRRREAALQLRVGLEALLVELRGAVADPGHERGHGDAAASAASEAGEAANAALGGELDARPRRTTSASCSRSASGSCAAAASCGADASR